MTPPPRTAEHDPDHAYWCAVPWCPQYVRLPSAAAPDAPAGALRALLQVLSQRPQPNATVDAIEYARDVLAQTRPEMIEAVDIQVRQAYRRTRDELMAMGKEELSEYVKVLEALSLQRIVNAPPTTLQGLTEAIERAHLNQGEGAENDARAILEHLPVAPAVPAAIDPERLARAMADCRDSFSGWSPMHLQRWSADVAAALRKADDAP